MKKILLSLLCFGMCFGITGCSDEDTTQETSDVKEMNYKEQYEVEDENGNFNISIDKIVKVKDSDVFDEDWQSKKKDNYYIAVLSTVDNKGCTDWEPAEMTLSDRIFIKTEDGTSLKSEVANCDDINGYSDTYIALGKKMKVLSAFIVPKSNKKIKVLISNQYCKSEEMKNIK